MKIKMRKKIVYVLGVLLLAMVAFGVGRRVTPIQTTSTERNQSSTSTLDVSGNKQLNQVREIAVVAKQFEFSPNLIRVSLGESIRLLLTSMDVPHGFSLPEFGINETLLAGQTVIVEFQATKKGEFPFACSIVCGSGHTGMKGMLIVE